MKLLGSTKSKINKDVTHLEITEVVSIHCNIINNHYQLNSRVLYTFVPNKSFSRLLQSCAKNIGKIAQVKKKL